MLENPVLVLWLSGYIISMVLGGIVVWLFITFLRCYLKIAPVPKSDNDVLHVPAWITGVIERVFFTTVVAFEVPGAAIAMIGWLTLKMVTNWNRPGRNAEEDKTAVPRAFSALLAGLVAMLFSMLGGLVCSGKLPLPYL